MRPPGPRLLSKTVTCTPDSACARAQLRPAMPAPITAEWSGGIMVASTEDRQTGAHRAGSDQRTQIYAFCPGHTGDQLLASAYTSRRENRKPAESPRSLAQDIDPPLTRLHHRPAAVQLPHLYTHQDDPRPPRLPPPHRPLARLRRPD